jgi:glutathione S-transferase
MTPKLKLYQHPLSSFCQKVIVALYESDTPFTAQLVNLGDPAERAAFIAKTPLGKFPLLEVLATGELISESSIINEYLAQHFPGAARLLPADPDAARDVRAKDRFIDLYVHYPMQRCVADKLRPADRRDPTTVAEAKAQIKLAYDMLEKDLAGRTWLAGDAFTLADCSAAPALFYARYAVPFGPEHRALSDYYTRLVERPSFARTIKDAAPFFHMFPGLSGL